MRQDIRSDRAGHLKKKWPAYGPLLDFYIAVRDAQAKVKPEIVVSSDRVAEFLSDSLANPEHVRRVGQDGFPLDVDASVNLFATLCNLGTAANQHFASQVEKIEHSISSDRLDLKALLQDGGRNDGIAQVAAENQLDRHVLSFLVNNSIRPSVEMGRDRLLIGFQPELWRKTCCPICGAAPTLSLLKGDPKLRFSLCSRCECQWLVDRLSCATCGNRNPETRSYFQPEGETTHRIDMCDECHYYIKTIDTHTIRSPDPVLEDLASLHLDLVAVEKGYERTCPNSWC